MKERHRYYAWGLVPMSLMSLLSLTQISLLNFLLYYLGFFWPYTLCTPASWNKWQQRSRRYSLLGLSHFLKSRLEIKLLAYKWPGAVVARNIMVIFFAVALELLTSSKVNIGYTFLGIGIFEFFYFFYSRKCSKKREHLRVDQTLEDSLLSETDS